MYVFKPSKFVRTKNVGSGKMLPLKAIPVKTHKILQLEDDLGCLVFYIVIYSMVVVLWQHISLHKYEVNAHSPASCSYALALHLT